MDDLLTAKFQLGFITGHPGLDDSDTHPGAFVSEFENLSDEGDRVKHVYACFGLAAYTANLVEQSLINIFVLMARLRDRNVSVAELDAIETEQARKTLGRLFRELRQHVQVDELAESVSIEAVEMRNFLIHKFFAAHAREFMSDAGRRDMLRELQGFIAKFELAELLLEALMGGLLELLEIPRDSFESYVSKVMERWLTEGAPGDAGRQT